MHDNRPLLAALFAEGKIDLLRGPLFDEEPGQPVCPIPFNRVEGMVLGLAVGDALGVPTESTLPGHRRTRYGEIRDFLPSRHNGERRGFPSDDTQLSAWTLDQLNIDGGLVPGNLAWRFRTSGTIFGIGRTMRQFLANMDHAGAAWDQAGVRSAGNGALMRIAPVVIPHLRHPTTKLWADVALAARVTHNDSASTAACLALARLLLELCQMHSPPASEWWLATAVETMRQVEAHDDYRSRSKAYAEWHGYAWEYLEATVAHAFSQGDDVLTACNRWHSGAYTLETLASVLYVMMRHGGSVEECIVRAVNDTRDNDTVAAIVGALAGALHGREAIPRRWLAGLTGRTSCADDGRLHQVLAEASQRWFGGDA